MPQKLSASVPIDFYRAILIIERFVDCVSCFCGRNLNSILKLCFCHVKVI
ncbi:unnamed protein product [Acidithrix sp. C25]|nr:unnamed protein product [Acidithrix sp. C25]